MQHRQVVHCHLGYLGPSADDGTFVGFEQAFAQGALEEGSKASTREVFSGMAEHQCRGRTRTSPLEVDDALVLGKYRYQFHDAGLGELGQHREVPPGARELRQLGPATAGAFTCWVRRW